MYFKLKTWLGPTEVVIFDFFLSRFYCANNTKDTTVNNEE